MALSTDATNLASLLVCLTQPDTNAIRNAEKQLKPILKDSRCVPALFEVLSARSSQPAPVRHVAAVLLRKRISGHYEKLPADYKTKLHADLLQFLASEPERTVRLGAVGVTAAICKLQEPANEAAAQDFMPWPELFQFISSASTDASPEARELSFLLMEEMIETIGTFLTAQFTQMAQLFHSCMTNPQEQPKVKISAIKALGGLMSFTADSPEVEIFSNLIPSLLQCSLECQKRNDEEAVSHILDVLYELAYSPSQIVSTHLQSIVNFSLGVMKDSNLEMNIRDSGALVVATLSESKPKQFGKDTALLSTVLETIFSLIEESEECSAGSLFQSNPAWREDQDNDYDPEDDLDAATETSMAQGTLDMLSCEIPKKYIFQPVVTMCVNRFSSPEEKHRKAGVACIGVIAEGCSEPLREHLSDLMPYVLQAAADSSSQVRECACFALGQLSEHCQPEILDYSEQVLPIAYKLLDDSAVTVQATSCYVLEMFCERLDPENVRPFLDPLVKKLASMLETTTKRSVQEMTVAALAATAVGAEEEFAPYVEGVATLMAKLMAIKDEKIFSLRGRALECMGHMAIAVGKDGFRPYFASTMQCACEGLTFDSTDLHEFAYAVFANLAKVMKEEFSPCLPQLVPHLLEVLKQDDGLLEKQQAENQQGAFGAFDDSDDEDEQGNYVIQVRTALLEAKKGAITAVGEISAHCGAAFVPYLEPTVELLQKAADNWHPLIKAEVAENFASMVVPSIEQNHGGSIEWSKGDISGNSPLSAHTTAVAATVLKQLVELMNDDDSDTVGKACSSVQSIIEQCGPHAFSLVGNDCLEKVHNLLNKTAPCQLADLEEGFGDEDDDHESFMIQVCDLVGAISRVMGTHFDQFLPQFLPLVCNYAKSSRPISDRSMAMGCLGEVAQGSGEGIKEFWKPIFLPAILAGLSDEDFSVKRNAAFCAGVCCEALGGFVVPDYPQILQAISPIFNINPTEGDSAAACVDNATAGVSRMIMASPPSVPLPQVLPVLLKALPLKNDMTENETVYKCLLGLLSMNNQEALALKSEFRRIFVEATADESQVDDETKAKLKQALPNLG